MKDQPQLVISSLLRTSTHTANLQEKPSDPVSSTAISGVSNTVLNYGVDQVTRACTSDPGTNITTAAAGGYTISALPLPSPVGYWEIGNSGHGYGTRFAVYTKPLDLHIHNTELLLGWKWVDGDN